MDGVNPSFLLSLLLLLLLLPQLQQCFMCRNERSMTCATQG